MNAPSLIAMFIAVLGIGCIVVLWIAGDYLSCMSCKKRKCFLYGHDVNSVSIEPELLGGKSVIVCRRCTHSQTVTAKNFYPMFMYLSASYFKRGGMWASWKEANAKNPFDKDFYDETKFF